MPKKIDGGKIVFGVDKKKFDKGIRGIEQRLKRLTAKLTALSNKFRTIALAGIAASGIALKFFAKQEMAEKRVTAVLKAQNKYSAERIELMKKTAAELQKNSLFGDEDILEAQATLLTAADITDDQIQRVTQAAADMAGVYKGDIKRAAKALASAMGDPIAGLSLLKTKFGEIDPAIKKQITGFIDAGEKAKAYDLILGIVEKRVGGTAKEMAKGTGVLTQLGNAFGDILEQIGEVVFKFIEPAAIKLRDLFSKLSSDKEFARLSANILVLTTGISLLMIAIFRLGGATLLVFGAKGFVFAAASSRALIVALRTLTFTVRGLMAATGFGLIIVGVSLLIENWDKLVAVLKKYSIGDIIQLMWLNAKIYLNKLIIAYEKTALAIQDNALFKAFGVGVDDNISRIKELTSEIAKFNDEINDIKKGAIDVPDKPKTADETVSGKPAPTGGWVDEFKEKLQAQTDGNLKLLENQLAYFEKKAQLEQEAKVLENSLDAENAQLKLDINAEKQEALDQQHLEFQERRAEADLEYKEILDELNLNYDEAEFERLFNNMTTADDLRKQERDKEILEISKQNALKKVIDDKDTKTSTKIRLYQQTKEFKDRQTFQDDLLAVAKKGSRLWKAIKIAQAISDLTIAITSKAPEAFANTSAAYPAPTGPILGAIHAAAIVGVALQGLSQIRSMNEGGIVGGVAGIDNNTTNLSQGELIVPNANFDEVIDAVVNSRTPATQSIVLELDGETVANIVLDKLEQDRAI